MKITTHEREQFLEAVWSYYNAHARDTLPWRQAEKDGSFDPYKILVSELMLQQTQVTRVVTKYHEFIHHFPTAAKLASAQLGEVLRIWQGLGYNRRAKFLWQAAQAVAEQGTFPHEQSDLVALPGVGVNTAGAIRAYAFNEPVVFVETNIRTVYFHHFYPEQFGVTDAEVRTLLEQTMDHEHPREFYWALMDYGSYLKTEHRNISQSRHYAKQSAFEGSRRQVRGRILKELSSRTLTYSALAMLIQDDRLDSVLDQLVQESLIVRRGSQLSLE